MPGAERGTRLALPRFIRTSSFRLTLGYAALLGCSSLVLFGLVYLVATHYVANQLDGSVSTELAEERADVRTAAGTGGMAALRAIVAAQADRAQPGAFYLLQDAAGRVLAGNLPPMRPVLGIRELTLPSGIGLRGRGVAAPDGGYEFVALSDVVLRGLRDAIADAFLWVVAFALMLALLGGVFMSFGVLARVEAISRASRRIVAGDLDQRIGLRGTDDEFDHLADSLNAMLDRIQVLMEGLRQVTVDIAHDLRTPLSRLRQRMELALAEASGAEGLRAALAGSVGEVDAILQTFAALLTLARLESGTDPSGFAALDLRELTVEVTEAYRAVAEDSGHVLRLEAPAGTLPKGPLPKGRLPWGRLSWRGNRALLAQALANLIENALRHTPPGSTIEVASWRDGGGIHIRVSDDGPGIPPALREAVLRPFFRLDVSRTTPGTGLGLSLVAAIAGAHRARLTLEDNRPGLAVALAFGADAEARAPWWRRAAALVPTRPA